MKNIAVYYSRLHDGGTERVVSSHISMWTSYGYNVYLITEEAIAKNDYTYKDAVKRVVLAGIDENEKTNYLKQVLIDFDIEVFVDNAWWKKDIIIRNSKIVKSIGIKYYVHVHNIFNAPYLEVECNMREWQHEVVNADLIIALDNATAIFYKALGANVAVVNNPIYTNLINNKRVADISTHNLLWIGRNDPNKCFKDTLRAFVIIKEYIEDAILNVVGDTSLEAEIKNIKGIENVVDSINFIGPTNKVEDYYLNNSLMIMSSKKEGFPYVLMESKCYGLPVVMYELPFLTLVKDGMGIVSCKSGDYKELAKQVISCLNDQEKMATLGIEARKSFDNLLEYDYRKTWIDIFENRTCEYRNSDNNDEAMIVAKLLLEQYDSLWDSWEMYVDSKSYRIGRLLTAAIEKVVILFKKIVFIK